jgi:hypothetical protein
MIVVKVEMHSAKTGAKREIAYASIWNNGGTNEMGHYGFEVSRDGRVVAQGRVRDYPRLDINVWKLVMRMLKSAFPDGES